MPSAGGDGGDGGGGGAAVMSEATCVALSALVYICFALVLVLVLVYICFAHVPFLFVSWGGEGRGSRTSVQSSAAAKRSRLPAEQEAP